MKSLLAILSLCVAPLVVAPFLKGADEEVTGHIPGEPIIVRGGGQVGGTTAETRDLAPTNASQVVKLKQALVEARNRGFTRPGAGPDEGGKR